MLVRSIKCFKKRVRMKITYATMCQSDAMYVSSAKFETPAFFSELRL